MSDNTKLYPCTIEELEPFLCLPSGLPLLKAKQRAKELKKAQGLTQSEALKIICWGNGLPTVRDFSQALEELEFIGAPGTNLSSFAKLYENDEQTGYAFKGTNDKWMLLNTRIYEGSLKFAVEMFVATKNEPAKKRQFIQSILDAGEKFNDGSIKLKDHVDSSSDIGLYDINVDIDKLLQGDGFTPLRYAVASAYNTAATQRFIVEASARAAKLDKEMVEKVGDHVYEYYSFGAACFNLDTQNKQLVTNILNCYTGW